MYKGREKAAMKYSMIIFLAGCLIGAIALLPAGESRKSKKLDKFLNSQIKKYQLDHLSAADQDKVKRMTETLLAIAYSEIETKNSAYQYLINEGYEEHKCYITSFEGTKYFVVRGLYGSYMTKDIPYGLSSFSLPRGDTLCKADLIEGVSEIIDTDGAKHEFYLAKWIKLK